MGIISGVLGLPSALCTTVCAAAVTVATAGMAGGAAGFVTFLAFLAPIMAIVGGVMGKSNPPVAGALLCVAAFFFLLNVILAFGILALICFALALAGGIVAFTQTKEVVEC